MAKAGDVSFASKSEMQSNLQGRRKDVAAFGARTVRAPTLRDELRFAQRRWKPHPADLHGIASSCCSSL